MSRASSKPVRVEVVVSLGLSLSLEESSSFRSFGADQCASSEGFLVTFTPEGVVRILIFPFDFFSEYFPQSPWLFRFIQPSTTQREPCQCRMESFLKKQSYTTKAGSPRREPSIGDRNALDPGGVPGEVIGIDLMNPNPTQGIMVALNPSDEGRIGTGRNT